TAQQLLQESQNPALNEQLSQWLEANLTSATTSLAARLAGVWTLLARSNDKTALSEKIVSNPAPELRAWAARWIGAHPTANLEPLTRLCEDADATVRAAAATALRQKTSGALTVDTVPPVALETKELLPLFSALLHRPSLEEDTYYPHIVWLAMEPQVAADPAPFLSLLAAHENTLSAYCLRRAMRRISDLTNAPKRQKELNTAMVFLGSIASKTILAAAALDGLIEAQKSKGALPTIDLNSVFAQLNANSALQDKARRLAAAFGDTSATKMLLAKINDRTASSDDRLKGIQAAREAKDDAARDELLKLIANEKQDQGLLAEAIRAVLTVGGYEVAYSIVDAWSRFSPITRQAAAEALVTRTKTARTLLAGIDKKTVQPQDISATARRALARSEDTTIAAQADRLLGRYRPTEGDKLALIAAKRRVVLNGQPDAKGGHEVAKKACFVCHKLHGEGADVGPDLTGVGRSSLDALLHNIIDPNEIIGNGYENTEIELKDGSTLSGRVVEDTDTRIKLIAAGPIEQTIAKSDIASSNGKLKIRKLEMSLMPEGLEQITDPDFRNLIWYLLNPPQDNRAWTPALRRELLGESSEPRAQK
ncbi:MAG TPA: HEAT repeat domain-containing protein, partial [Verrucomicrobiae bacterium]|nr:HEAT repeat domain-containing protein [Verrucomicrobiae bacterium]